MTLSDIPIILNLHWLHYHTPAYMFQISSHCLPPSYAICRHLSPDYCISSAYKFPTFLSLQNIYRWCYHLIHHVLFHCNFPPYLLHLQWYPNFIIPCLLSPPTSIVCFHHLKFLLFHPHVPPASFTFLWTLLSRIWSSWSSSLLSSCIYCFNLL